MGEYEAVEQRGTALFGADWQQIVDAADFVQPEGDQYPYVHDGVDGPVSAVLGSASTEDVLDLAGLILLRGSDAPGAVIAFSLLQGLAQQRPSTCDSALALAHAQSLLFAYVSPGDGQLWQDAKATCGDDPAIRYVIAMNELLGTYDSTCGDDGQPDPDRTPMLEEFRALQKDHPQSALGFLGEADVLLAEALVDLNDGVQPFTARAALERATAALDAAAQRTTDPAVEQERVRILLAQGEVQRASEITATWPTDAVPPSMLALAAAVNARNGDFAGAQMSAALAQGFPPEAVLPSVVYPDHLDQIPGFSRARGDSFFTNCGGASTVVDGAFVPTFRHDFAGWLLSAYGSGYHGDDAPNLYGALADPHGAIESGTVDDFGGYEWLQNGLRMWGSVEEARAVAEAWLERSPDNPAALDRLGEAHYLLGDYDAAAQAFSASLDAWPMNEPEDDGTYFAESANGPAWDSLRLGAALAQLGRDDQARQALEAAQAAPLIIPLEQVPDRQVEFYALSQLARLDHEAGDDTAAMVKLDSAVALAEQYQEEGHGVLLRGAEDQLGVIVELALDDPAAAQQWATAAVSRDPANPLFIEAKAEADRAAGAAPAESSPSEPSAPSSATATGDGRESATTSDGQDDDLVTAYQAAVDADGSLFSSWNNLGVALWHTGDREEAVNAFAHAVDARPNYALGWFNLGSAWADEPGVAAAVAAQGALGHAARLNDDLRNAEPQIAYDDTVYETNLDVSRPVPTDWAQSDSLTTGGNPLTIGLILVVLLRAASVLGADAFFSNLTESALRTGTGGDPNSGPPTGGRWGVLRRIRDVRPAWYWMAGLGVAAAWWLSDTYGWWVQVLALALILGLFGTHMVVSRIAGGRQDPIVRSTSVPATTLAGLLTAVGVGFTPPPVVQDGIARVRAVRVAAAALGLIAVLSFVVSRTTGAPLASVAAGASLLVASSTLVPVNPIDGALLGLGKWREAAITLVLAVGTVILAFHLV
ncbi:tetratricopeptide repeat protein [uncultured Cellulomonas sp.]|uniref:tetratricopeptide repeat protein n=1 Tax=uncultured Cellulomonas sp. TaxID=189682 RepID=UPI0028EB03A9|nr:tetratricopeptide repeat protein [uncultured Cellulomonas sp.]